MKIPRIRLFRRTTPTMLQDPRLRVLEDKLVMIGKLLDHTKKRLTVYSIDIHPDRRSAVHARLLILENQLTRAERCCVETTERLKNYLALTQAQERRRSIWLGERTGAAFASLAKYESTEQWDMARAYLLQALDAPEQADRMARGQFVEFKMVG